ncbi:hypothetical protein CIT292_11223 [Citrobacter youngae ATCC 29220]|uniref:Uncharacterized protein n=1 Tax=Citrobacter youngae ATCC 29220 TaxID=500640 RepID=D4BKY8_9ENTR|nr:hypothetical protein CIT292_11223 [Citrobacter youngae ATCC 29220]
MGGAAMCLMRFCKPDKAERRIRQDDSGLPDALRLSGLQNTFSSAHTQKSPSGRMGFFTLI